MTKRTLADLQGAFATPSSNFKPSNYYPFFLMKDGQQAVVRFLPDKNLENPMGFLVEKVVHNLVINGNILRKSRGRQKGQSSSGQEQSSGHSGLQHGELKIRVRLMRFCDMALANC